MISLIIFFIETIKIQCEYVRDNMYEEDTRVSLTD